MKRWFVAIIFGSLGRLFNNPQLVYRLEDRLANSAPLRQLARTIVALYQRGSWEIQQLKSITDKQLKIDSKDVVQKIKDIENELKKKMEGKF